MCVTNLSKTRFPVPIICKDLKALENLLEVFSHHHLGVQWSTLGEILEGKPLSLPPIFQTISQAV